MHFDTLCMMHPLSSPDTIAAAAKALAPALILISTAKEMRNKAFEDAVANQQLRALSSLNLQP